MIEGDINKYFETNIDKYYEPVIIIDIIEGILGKSINDIKKELNEKKIIVTESDIEQYLENKFTEEEPELKERLARNRDVYNKNNFSKQDISNLSNSFYDKLVAVRYYFEPYTLEYFIKYTDILRNKIAILLNLIEHICTKRTSAINNILNDLDITINEVGCVLKSDIVRVLSTFLYNIEEFNMQIDRANDMSTYLVFKISRYSHQSKGVAETEIYPCASLQLKNLHNDEIKGNIPLTNKQKNIIINDERSACVQFVKKFY